MNSVEASERCGLPVKTTRNYEGIGLASALGQPKVYRDYPDSHIKRVRLLKLARDFGLPNEDCRKLQCPYQRDRAPKAEESSLASQHLGELEHKAQEIQHLAEALQALVEDCSGSTTSDCPIGHKLGEGAVGENGPLDAALARTDDVDAPYNWDAERGCTVITRHSESET